MDEGERNVNNKNKGYLKIYITVDIKSKKILSIQVTDEHVQYSKMLLYLGKNIMKSDSIMSIGKLFAEDGSYEGNDIFRYLSDNGILPCIKVRKNAKIKLKADNFIRNLSVISQKKDLQKWKDSVAMDKDGLLKLCFLP